MKASLLHTSSCILGEGAYWHEERKSFFWVDIQGKMVYEFNWITKKINQWNTPSRVSFLTEGSKNIMILALQGSIAKLDLRTGKLTRLVNVEKNIPGNRTNDGGIDPKGRLWIGTMELHCAEGKGSLYCIEKDLTVQKKLAKLSIPNGITWTHDNKKMYHVDTTRRSVNEYAFDLKTGAISGERTVITVPEDIGSPDGMCMDEEGMLWIAHWGGFGVYRWNPHNGKLLDKIELSVPQVTSCAFGGDNLEYLFITTAKDGLSDDDLKKYSDSGNIYIAKPGVKGMPRHKFSVGKQQTRKTHAK